jgi:hypothetical protein
MEQKMTLVSTIGHNLNRTDDELMGMLDNKIDWKMLTGNPIAFTRRPSLREMIVATYDMSMSGKSPGSISESGDSIYIELPQIWRLWKRLNLVKS